MQTANEGVTTINGTNAERLAFRLPNSTEKRLFLWRETDTNRIYVSTGMEWFPQVKLVSAEPPLSSASLNGHGYAASTSVTIPAGSTYSVRLQNNSDCVVRFARSSGLVVEYCDGDYSGDFVKFSFLKSLHSSKNSGFEAVLEVYDGSPDGDRILSADNEIAESWYVNSSATIALSNTTEAAIETFFSIGIEDYGVPTIPFALTSSTQLETATEMGDYNGDN